MKEMQPDLEFVARRGPGMPCVPPPEGGTPNGGWLEDLLIGHGGWMSARDIMESTHGRVLDREVRDVASKTPKVISGQRGYKHIANATAEEIDHAANWLESQGRKMIERAIAIRQQAHKILG